MFRVHTPIIRSIRCWFAAYGFVHRVFGWVVVLRAAAQVVCMVQILPRTICTVHTTHAAALKTTTHPKTRCRKPYAATQHLMLLMMGVCIRNMSSKNALIKLPCCIKLAFQVIAWGRCTVKKTFKKRRLLYYYYNFLKRFCLLRICQKKLIVV